MDRLDRTMILTLLTVMCLIGTGLSELADLDDTMFISFFGFMSFGIATIVSAFYKGEKEDHDDTTDSDTP